jgi:hypothetical protein
VGFVYFGFQAVAYLPFGEREGAAVRVVDNGYLGDIEQLI